MWNTKCRSRGVDDSVISTVIHIIVFFMFGSYVPQQTFNTSYCLSVQIIDLVQSLSISVNLCQSLSISVDLSRSLSILVDLCQSCSISVSLCQSLSISADHGRSWSILVDLGRSWSILVDLGRCWLISVDLCRSRSILNRWTCAELITKYCYFRS